MSQEPWKWYVYILECQDGTFYTGITWDPDARYEQHKSGLGGKYTAQHGVRRLAYMEEFEDYDTARHREIQIKDWSREKKMKLIKGEWGPQ